MGFIVNILSVAFTNTLQAAHTYSNSSALYFEGFVDCVSMLQTLLIHRL